MGRDKRQEDGLSWEHIFNGESDDEGQEYNMDDEVYPMLLWDEE